MANPGIIPSQPFVFFIIISSLTSISGLDLGDRLRNDAEAIRLASNDYGNIIHEVPSAVLYPSSVADVIKVVQSSNSRGIPSAIAARGQGHSVRGQAMTRGGVVVYMSSLSKSGIGIRVSGDSLSGFYADVGAEQMWIDVLKATMAQGLSPVSWTDYLYLSVGGTLSNAGISGQTFLRGPQIHNVLELDVVTGKGEFVTCSRERNHELFFAVLGGLGQFGIITRARIVLEKAPTRVKWVRLLYSDFSIFSRDQEHLVSGNAANYVEGFVISDESTTNEWRSSFSSTSNQSDIVSLLKKQGVLYAIELVKYYDNQTANTIDEEFGRLLKELNYIPGWIFSTDATIVDFLARVPNLDNLPGPRLSHPWLNLFIPKSRISDFNAGVLVDILPRFNETSPLFIFYPLNRNKWDDRASAVTPDEDIFYTLALLHTTAPNDYQRFDDLNNKILEFCNKAGIKVKQYLPNYRTKADWVEQYGPKWSIIQKRKAMFDPKRILSPGQRIFNSAA